MTANEIYVTTSVCDDSSANTIGAGPVIEYYEIKIKVLDCRSGEPVKNSKLFRIKIFNGSNQIGITFKKDHQKTDTSLSIVKQSQIALNCLGYYNGTPGNNYGDLGRSQYNEYWNNRVPEGTVEQVTSGNPPDELLKLIIKEYNCLWGTDDNGILTVRIPKITFTGLVLSGNELLIEVGFFDFPIILEELKDDERSKPPCRNNANSCEATGYSIKWTGGQSTDWNGNFGWKMKKGDKVGEFKVSESLKIKGDNNEFGELDKDQLSKFYDENDNNSPHFVLFAMQWCQTVWDDIADPANASAGDISAKSYIQDANYQGLNMHIVTTYMDLGGSDPYGGKGYGKCEYQPGGTGTLWRSGTGHRGIDLHAPAGANVFALHGGTVTHATSSGNTANLSWTGSMTGTIGHMHLSEFMTSNNAYVKAGEIIGLAGRTGNLYPVSYQPGHVHLNIQATPAFIVGLRNDLENAGLDEKNLACVPFNDYPLLFPCSCVVTQASTNPANCNFNNTAFASACWAVGELKCPHMQGDSKKNRRVQAQLKYLYNDDNTTYKNPGILDGNWGNVPASEQSSVSNTRKAIKAFKTANGLLSGFPDDYKLTDSDIQTLNSIAPVTETG